MNEIKEYTERLFENIKHIDDFVLKVYKNLLKSKNKEKCKKI